jgi:hypothetical protein
MKQEQTDAMKRAWKASIFATSKFESDLRRKNLVRDIFYEGYAAALEAGKAVDENGLKPCPFCGGEADLLKAKPDDAWPEDYVTCKNHDCDIFGNYSATVESWNRRAR